MAKFNKKTKAHADVVPPFAIRTGNEEVDAVINNALNEDYDDFENYYDDYDDYDDYYDDEDDGYYDNTVNEVELEKERAIEELKQLGQKFTQE